MDELKFHVRNVFIWFKSLDIPLPKDITSPMADQERDSHKLSAFFSPATNAAEYLKVTDKSSLDLINILKDGVILLKISERLWSDIVANWPDSQQPLSSSWGTNFEFVSIENINKFLAYAKKALQHQMESADETVAEMLFTPFDLVYEFHIPKVLKCLSMLSLIFPTAPIPDTDKVSQEKETVSGDLSILIGGLWKGPKLSQEYDALTPQLRKKIIYEYYESEKQYIDALTAVDKLFVQPLSKREELITSKELAMLFGNIKDLLIFHKTHLKSLAEAVEQAARHQEQQLQKPEKLDGEDCLSIGKIILNMTQGFELYRIFCSSYFDAQAVRCRLESKAGFREFLEARSSSFSLSNHISIPYRRLLRYPLQIQSILKCTSKEHVDYASLSKAVGQIIKLMKELTGAKLKKRHSYLTNILKQKISKSEKVINDLFAENGVLKTVKLGYLIFDGRFDIIGNNQVAESGLILLFEKYLLVLKPVISNQSYKIPSDVSVDIQWEYVYSFPINNLTAYIDKDQMTLTIKPADSERLSFKAVNKLTLENWSNNWNVLIEKSNMQKNQKLEKLGDLFYLSKYDNSPTENEINAICENFPQNTSAVTDERLFFWSLIMLSDCGLLEPKYSGEEELSENHDPGLPTTRRTASHLDDMDTNMTANVPPNTVISLTLASQKTNLSAQESTKKASVRNKKHLDDSDSDEKEKSSDEETDDDLLHDGLTVQQVKKNKKSRSKARALLGVGTANVETRKGKVSRARDQVIDDRIVTGRSTTDSDRTSILSKSSDKSNKRVGSKLFSKIKGPLFKFGSDKDEGDSQLQRPQEIQTLPQPQPQMPDQKQTRNPSINSNHNSISSQSSGAARLKEPSVSSLLKFKQKHHDTTSIFSAETSYTRNSEMVTAIELVDSDDKEISFRLKKNQNNEGQDTETSNIKQLTLIPVYMENKSSYKKVSATSDLTAQDVIIQMLRKNAISLDEIDYYNLYEENLQEGASKSMKPIRLMRDSNVMDLYDWWVQTNQTDKKILVLRREETYSLTVDRKSKAKNAQSPIQQKTKDTIMEETFSDNIKVSNVQLTQDLTWSLKDSETLWSAIELKYDKHIYPLVNGKLVFVNKKSSVKATHTAAVNMATAANVESNEMLFSPPPSTPPPLPPELDQNMQLLIDPYSTGAAENLEDSITRIVKHIEPSYVVKAVKQDEKREQRSSTIYNNNDNSNNNINVQQKNIQIIK